MIVNNNNNKYQNKNSEKTANSNDKHSKPRKNPGTVWYVTFHTSSLVTYPGHRSCSLVGYKLTLASALSGHLGRCFPALSPSLPGWVKLSELETKSTWDPHGQLVVLKIPKIWGAQGEKAPKNLGLSTLSSEWLWLYVNFESSTQKKTQSIGVIIRGGMERKGLWNHNPAIQIRTPMDILRFCCTLSNHSCISQFDGFFSLKNGAAATCRPCLAGIFPVLPIFGMNVLGCLKIGYPPIQEFLLISIYSIAILIHFGVSSTFRHTHLTFCQRFVHTCRLG